MNIKRGIAWILIVVLLVGLMPIGVLAAEEQTEEQMLEQSKEQSEEQTEEQSEEQTEEKFEEQTEEQSEEQTEEQFEEQTEMQSEEQTADQPEEQTEEQPEEQTEEQPEEQTEEQSEEQAEEQSEEQVEPQAEEQPQKESAAIQIPFHVNPLYEDVYTEEDFRRATAIQEQTADAKEPEGESLSGKQDVLYAATYVTADKAATQLRSYMKARTTKFELYVKGSNSDYKTLINSIMMEAVAHTGNPKEGDYLLWQYGGWNGEVTQTYEDGANNFHFTITMAYYTTAAQEKALDTAVTNLLKSLNVGSKSSYQKVCAVYNYLCDNVTYDYDNLEDTTYTLKHTAYAALMNKTAVCQGYALLFYRLMLELGVDNRIIVGVANGGSHGWNIVKLGNVYYNVDATWDSIQGDRDYFLRNSLNFLDHARYLDYATTKFHTDYPMSETDYVDGVAGEPEYYFAFGMCGDDAYWAIDRDKNLTIAGTGAIANYESDYHGTVDTVAPWWSWKDGFNTVIIEEGITSIGRNAFYGMENISNVVLPDTLLEIGASVFEKCTGMKTINLPTSLETIGHSAFCECSKLTQIVIPDSLKKIDDWAFWLCTSLKKVTFGKSVEYIGSQAFRETALTSVVIPDSVTTLDTMAFYVCLKLKSVKVGASLENINSYAFASCPLLTDVELPEGLKKISSVAFQHCDSLSEITIPANVTEMDGFGGCDSLKKIIFCGDAPAFGYYTFSGVTATAYYPENYKSWTEDVMQDYEGDITWYPYTVPSVAKRVSDGKPSLKWHAVDGATSYQVYRSTSKNGTYAKVFTTTGTSYTHVSAEPGTTYYYKLKTVYSNGSELFSDVVSATYNSLEMNITVGNRESDGKPTLKWAKVDGAASYQVYRSTAKNGTYSKVFTTTGTSYTHVSAEAGKTYYYQIKAVYSDGSGELSDVVSVTCLADFDLKALNWTSSGKPTLRWNAIDGAEEYQVYRSTSENGSYARVFTTTGTSYTHVSAVVDGRYYYKVKAIFSSGRSVFSEIVSKACICARTTATAGNRESDGKPNLKWGAVEGAAKYQVYRSTSAGSGFVRVFTTTGTSYTHVSAEEGVTYYYKVRAVSENGTYGAFSTVIKNSIS